MPVLVDIAALGARLFPIWLFFLLSFALFQILGWKKIIREDFGVAWTLGAVATGVGFVVITEMASAANQLTPVFCRVAWLAADLGLLAVVIRQSEGNRRRFMAAWRARVNRWGGQFASQSRIAVALAIASGVGCFLGGVVVGAAPSTRGGCHALQQPPIMHWLQQRNTGNYPTNIPRQVEYPPGAEMIVAQLMLLTGNDLPANLPQWWALLTTALLAGFLAQELPAMTPLRNGVVRPASAGLCAAFAVVLTVTTPGAATEAVSSLNNVLAGMWTMAALVCGLLVLRHRENYFYQAACGAALALGICTKQTTFLYLAPFVLLAGIELARKRFFLSLLGLGGVSLVLVGALNGGWMLGNVKRLGNPLISTRVLAANAGASMTPPKVAANMIRNVSFYTRTPFQPVTTAFNDILEFISDLIGEDLDNPSWIYEHQRFQFAAKSDISDGSALGNCYAGALLIAACVGFAMRFKGAPALGSYAAAVGASFILFSAYLRWDPWHTRLEFDYFFFAAPFIAGVIANWFNRWAVGAIAGFLLVNATLALTNDPTFPTLSATFHTRPREVLYFAARPELQPTTAALADDIMKSGCTNVLLKIGPDTWEYPLWALLKDRGFKGTINHALVENTTAAAAPQPLDLPRTVLLTMHANSARIPEDFSLVIDYDTWKARYKAGIAEERARMIDKRTVLRYTFHQKGALSIAFEPRDSMGNPATNGNLDVTVQWVDPATFQPVGAFRTNLLLVPTTRFSCPVLAGSATIFITNTVASNAVAYLSKLDASENVSR